MYGGDEVSAVIMDLGTSFVRTGYAGEDTPKCCFQSAVGCLYSTGNDNTVGEGQKGVGESQDVEMKDASSIKSENVKYYVGTNSLSFRRDYMEVHTPIQDGLVTNWDEMEQLWDHALKERLRLDPKEHPLLMSEASFNTRPLREKLTELMFEKYETPALFVAKDAVLTCFASGKSSGLVLDSGGGVTKVTPVHDGYALQKSIVKSSLAGEMLTDEYLKILEQKNTFIRPHYSIQSKKEIRPNEFEVLLKDLPHTTESYRQYAVKQVVRDVKETIFRVSDAAFDEEANSNIPAIGYELPDGNTLEVGTDRFKLPELMFNPDPLNKRDSPAEEYMGIPQMIYSSISKCDADVRRELLSSIVVTGGNTLFPQFAERLNKELMEKSPPQMYKVKLISPTSSIERKFSVWIGGSILGSLGTFQQMWMSKQEYEEYGRSLIERKCP